MLRSLSPGWRTAILSLATVTVIAVTPFLCALIGNVLEGASGCQTTETGQSCIFLGSDISGLLYFFDVMAWFVIPAAPLVVLVLLAWLGAGAVAAVQRLRPHPHA